MFATLALLLSAAQGAAPAATTPAPAPTPAYAVMQPAFGRTPKGTDAVDARIARADSLAFAGEMGDAEHLLRTVIYEQTTKGQYARAALWHLAMAYDLVGNQAKMAKTLDQLAEAAATFGDPQMELEASFEAARLHVALREGRAALDRIERIQCLMQSPAIPESVKADYQARIVEGPAKK